MTGFFDEQFGQSECRPVCQVASVLRRDCVHVLPEDIPNILE
jgi:hypothetical protein